MTLEKIKIIFRRELQDTIRDRRTIFVMILIPLLLMPIFMLLPSYLMKQQMEGNKRQIQRIGIVNPDASQGIVNLLKMTPGIEVVEVNDPREAIDAGKVEASIEIPSDYEEKLKNGSSVNLLVYFDGSNTKSSTALDKLQAILTLEKDRILKARLATFKISEEFLEPVIIKPVNTASEDKMGAMLASLFLPMMIAMWASIGGMYTVIDATAGEKERRTLEPLLISPVTRTEIVLGKWAAVLAVSLISVVMVMVTMLATVKFGLPILFSDMSEEVAFNFTITPLLVIVYFIGAVVLAALMSAVMMVVCFYARSFKEAQTYLSPITFLVVIPGMASSFLQGINLGTPYYAIPILNILLIMQDAMVQQLEPIKLAVALGTTVIYSIVAIWVAILVFKNEKVIYRS